MSPRSSKGPSAAKLDNKTVIITGCNTGIGKETALDLFKRGTGVTAYALHPGGVNTELGRHVPWIIWKSFSLFLKTPVQGAQTSIYCAVNEQLENVSGLYYSDCKAVEPSSRAKDDEVAKKLWKVSCVLVNIEASSE